ncbi:hypothetical protein D3C84_1320380 [compost metagenome]
MPIPTSGDSATAQGEWKHRVPAPAQMPTVYSSTAGRSSDSIAWSPMIIPHCSRPVGVMSTG